MFSFLVIDTERVWRGGQDQLLALLKGLRQRGHQVHLVCHPETLLRKRAAENGISVHSLVIRSEIGFFAFLSLIRILRKVGPDVLAFNTPKAIFVGTLASKFTSVRAKIIFRRVNFPLHKTFFSRLKYTWGIDCVIAISESIHLQLQMCGIPGSMIRTVYEGMDLSLYPKPAAGKMRQPGKPAVIGTVAHLSREKGLNYLIEAAALIPGVREKMRFVIVGDGKCLQELKDLAVSKGLQDIFHFAGFHSNTHSFMNSFDLFALPSLSEGLSSAILEAMAAGLPIVATKVGGIPELVKHGENGLLVAPANPELLAQAIERMVKNPEESERMGRRGRKRMEVQFTLDRKILETERLCYELIGRTSDKSRAEEA